MLAIMDVGKNTDVEKILKQYGVTKDSFFKSAFRSKGKSKSRNSRS